MQIESGGVASNKALVDANGNLLTLATTLELLAAASVKGDAFNAPTSQITLTTTGSYSGLLYLKNTTSRDIHIGGFSLTSDVAGQWRIIRNPTTGTLISGGSDIVPANLDFASGAAFQGDTKEGVDAQTITDGSIVSDWNLPAGRTPVSTGGSVILRSGNSIAITFKPSVAGDASLSMNFFFV